MKTLLTLCLAVTGLMAFNVTSAKADTVVVERHHRHYHHVYHHPYHRHHHVTVIHEG